MVVTPRMLGAPIKRGEDPRLVTGAGSYLEDIAMQGMAYLVFARSPHAHARISRLDVSAARSSPGVIAVLSGEDVASALPADLPGDWPPLADEHRPPNPVFARDKV